MPWTPCQDAPRADPAWGRGQTPAQLEKQIARLAGTAAALKRGEKLPAALNNAGFVSAVTGRKS